MLFLGAINLNAFVLSQNAIDKELGLSKMGIPRRAGLFLLGAMMNHSCNPNVHFECRDSANELYFFAARDIKPDEELTITYTPLFNAPGKIVGAGN